MHRISECYTDEDYEELLKNLADTLLDEDYLEEQNKLKKEGNIRDCKGSFEYVNPYESEDW